jgi:hypothetical protein
MRLPQAFVDAFERSRYNPLPCEMWWRSLDLMFHENEEEGRLALGWLRRSARRWQVANYRDDSRVREMLESGRNTEIPAQRPE